MAILYNPPPPPIVFSDFFFFFFTSLKLSFPSGFFFFCLVHKRNGDFFFPDFLSNSFIFSHQAHFCCKKKNPKEPLNCFICCFNSFVCFFKRFSIEMLSLIRRKKKKGEKTKHKNGLPCCVCVFVCEVLSILLFYIRTRPFMIYIYTYNYIHPEVLYCYTCNTCIVLCVVCLSLCVQCVSLYGADVFSFFPFLYKTREKKHTFLPLVCLFFKFGCVQLF